MRNGREEVKDTLKKQFLLVHKSICVDLLNLYKQKAYNARDTVRSILFEVIKIIDVHASFVWTAQRTKPSGYMMNRGLVFQHNENKLAGKSVNPGDGVNVLRY